MFELEQGRTRKADGNIIERIEARSEEGEEKKKSRSKFPSATGCVDRRMLSLLPSHIQAGQDTL